MGQLDKSSLHRKEGAKERLLSGVCDSNPPLCLIPGSWLDNGNEQQASRQTEFDVRGIPGPVIGMHPEGSHIFIPFTLARGPSPVLDQ